MRLAPGSLQDFTFHWPWGEGWEAAAAAVQDSNVKLRLQKMGKEGCLLCQAARPHQVYLTVY
jgi:hypothetical protein